MAEAEADLTLLSQRLIRPQARLEIVVRASILVFLLGDAETTNDVGLVVGQTEQRLTEGGDEHGDDGQGDDHSVSGSAITSIHSPFLSPPACPLRPSLPSLCLPFVWSYGLTVNAAWLARVAELSHHVRWPRGAHPHRGADRHHGARAQQQ